MKKGFTLVELIGVIALLGLVLIVGTSSIVLVIKDNQKKMRETQINSYLNSVRTWAMENTSILPKDGKSLKITLKTLSDSNTLNSTIIDPVTNRPFSMDTYFCIYNNNGDYQYTYEGNC